MDEKKKDVGPERVGSWKAASPTGVGIGDRSDGTSASGFIAGRPKWEPDEEFEEELDAATMDGGAFTTGAAPVGAMPGEDDVSGASRTADFTRGADAEGEVSPSAGSWAPSSTRDSARADAAREAFPPRDRERIGRPDADAEEAPGAAEQRGSTEEDEGRAQRLKAKASEAQQRMAEAGQKASGRLTDAGHRASEKLSEVGHKASGKAKSQFNDRREDLAGRLEGFQGQLGERANAPAQRWVGRLGDQADEVLGRAAQTLREKDADELLGMARAELRQRPLLYAGGMLAVGFLAARLMRAMEGGHATGD